MDTLDLTPAQQDAAEQEALSGPTQEDWDWYFENTYVDPAERVF